MDVNVSRSSCQQILPVLQELKACAKQRNVSKGRIIHDQIKRNGLIQKNIMLGNTLVSMYAKCGEFANALDVFDELSVRTVVTYNALISGYSQQGLDEEALECFHQMQSEGLSPDAVTYLCVLKSCSSIQALGKGEEIYSEIVRQGLLGKDNVLGTTLVNMYAKCGALVKAVEVFDQLPFQDTVSFTALITGYAKHGFVEEAFYFFETMKLEGHSPNIVTISSMLKACSAAGAADKGKVIHAANVREWNNAMIGTSLVDMYTKCGELRNAHQVFDELPFPDVVAWTTLITGYVENGHAEESFHFFERMQNECLLPSTLTYSCVAKACGCVGAAAKGKRIHSHIVGNDFLENDNMLDNALMDMYSKCGLAVNARRMFFELPFQDEAAWTSIIAGHAQYGHYEEAIQVSERMLCDCLLPNIVTFGCILKACSNSNAIDKGKEVHTKAIQDCLVGKYSLLGNELVDMYAKCGKLTQARQVFGQLPVQDVVSWNTLIAGYTEHGVIDEAYNSFTKMQSEGVSPNVVTFACILKACGSAGAIEKGKEIHNEILKQGFLGKDLVLDNALVGMYAKCGELSKALEVFSILPMHDIVTWTTLITGFSRLGSHEKVFELFNKMVRDGIEPNLITLAVMLTACNYSGLTERGQIYFDSIRTSYGLVPTVEHYSCMVGLFAQTGHFDKALEAIMQMPSSDHLPAWFALLGACQKSGNLKLAKFAFKKSAQLDSKNAVPYVYLSNLYSSMKTI